MGKPLECQLPGHARTALQPWTMLGSQLFMHLLGCQTSYHVSAHAVLLWVTLGTLLVSLLRLCRAAILALSSLALV